jgi:proteic killer suppression protein
LNNTPDRSILRIVRVEFSARAKKSSLRLPNHIADRLRRWVFDVEYNGIEEARKRPGYHDEPLQGHPRGQRSAHLNRACRVIYVEIRGDLVVVVRVLEVTKHGY